MQNRNNYKVFDLIGDEGEILYFKKHLQAHILLTKILFSGPEFSNCPEFRLPCNFLLRTRKGQVPFILNKSRENMTAMFQHTGAPDATICFGLTKKQATKQISSMYNFIERAPIIVGYNCCGEDMYGDIDMNPFSCIMSIIEEYLPSIQPDISGEHNSATSDSMWGDPSSPGLFAPRTNLLSEAKEPEEKKPLTYS